LPPMVATDDERASVGLMSRGPRFQASGAIYHLTSRGTEGRDVYLDDLDRRLFLRGLSQVVEECSWRCGAYCLMTNHFHLLVQTLEPNLAVGMHRLNSDYANYFNRRHDHVGHLFQSRYASELIERESHLLETCRYIVLNPVRAGLCRRPGNWPWSSYRATAGYESASAFLDVDWVLGQFGTTPRQAALRYVEFVAEGLRDAAESAVSGGLAPGHGPKWAQG
jgi:REP-associated tyrosine transposase